MTHAPYLLILLLAASGACAAPLRYEIDPQHTYPSFEADHMGMSVWRGKLKRSSGQVVLDRQVRSGTVEVTMELASVDFGHDELNHWAVGAEFFDVEQYPSAVYKGRLTGFRRGAPTRVLGELTLHGVSRPLTLAIRHFKCMPHPLLKREFCGADAYASFSRDQFGLAAGRDWGFDMQVRLRIQVEAILAEPDGTPQ